MGDRWFYRNDDEFKAFAELLKLGPCPRCRAIGTLVRHGFLRGYDCTSQRITVRARRVFCSNRNTRPGCGHTFSVWIADKIRRLSLTTSALWQFLQRAATDGIFAAIRAADVRLSDRTWQRIWKRFDLGQSKIRTALLGLCPPPQLPAGRPAAAVLSHLQAAFHHAPCPIAAFQHTLQTFFT